VLEVGAGIGNFTNLLVNNYKVTAIDIERKYVGQLKKKFGGRLKVGFGDIEKGEYFFKNHLPAVRLSSPSKSGRQEKFDSVVCLNVLEHIEFDKKALKNIQKLLKPSGKLILLVPAHKFLYSDFDKELGHFRRYAKNEIEEKLLEIGMEKVELKFLNWWAAIGWFVFLKLGRKTRLPRVEVSVFDKIGRIFLFPEKFISPPFGLSIFAVFQKK
jgi:SAM-dependent methyltransferase